MCSADAIRAACVTGPSRVNIVGARESRLLIVEYRPQRPVPEKGEEEPWMALLGGGDEKPWCIRWSGGLTGVGPFQSNGLPGTALARGETVARPPRPPPAAADVVGPRWEEGRRSSSLTSALLIVLRLPVRGIPTTVP